MAEHLTALDATFLELEEADDAAHMHIGGVMLFDGDAPSIEEIRELLSARIDLLPRYRQRLSEHHTGGLRWPAWVADDRFDLAAHVRHASLPDPGGEAELLEWAADYWSHRLDRGRPLWEMVLLDGLAGGWALVTKTHHCLVDGVGSVDGARLMLDTDLRASRRAPELAQPPAPIAGHRLPSWVTEPAGAVRHPKRLAEWASAARGMVEVLVRDEVLGAPQTSLNEPIGATRRFAAVRVSLDDVKAIRGALGGTVNDVVLSVVAAGLGSVLAGRGEATPTLRAMVPVNVRAAGDRLAEGNKVSSLFVDLPVAPQDAPARHAEVRRRMDALKGGRKARGASALVATTALAPPVLHAVAARSLFATRLFNVTVTNVPGPRVPLYACGSRLREVLPLVPLATAHDVGIAIVSYDGRLTFGLVADHDSVPDLDALAGGIEDEAAALLDAARAVA